MADYYVNNATLLGGEICAEWKANHAYAQGARCVCTITYSSTRRKYVYECTTAGTSHATTQPTWPTSGTVNDGTAEWTTRAPTSWDNATCYLFYAVANDMAGATIYVHNAHAEALNPGATGHYTIIGTTAGTNPMRILCVNKADNSLSTGAVVEHTGTSTAYNMKFSYYGYSYGVTYKSGSHILVDYLWTIENAPGSKIFIVADARKLATTNTSPTRSCGTFLGDIEFLGADSYILVENQMVWKRGSLIAATPPTKLLYNNFAFGRCEITNVDLSALGNNTLVVMNYAYISHYLFARCKLPETFTPVSGDIPDYNQSWVKLHQCTGSNNVYSLYEACYCGVCQHETTIVRTGGASDGTTPISIKMVSSSYAGEGGIYRCLISPPIHGWTASNTEKTFTVELVHDSATALQDDEIWMEFEYPINNTDGLGGLSRGMCLPLGTPANIPDSSETWTTTGLTNPNTRKLTATVTPGKAGPITAKVYLAKASTTVYIDPKITES